MAQSTKCVCAQSDQSLRCPYEETLGPELSSERTAKTLIRLGGCAQSDLSLRWVHIHFVDFVMSRLNASLTILKISCKNDHNKHYVCQ